MIALRFFKDANHAVATTFYERSQENSFLWSPWHRVEVANALRQMSRGSSPMLNVAEARRIIHELEREVRLGYFQHIEADWRDVMRTAYEMSSEHGFELYCRSADLLHVAYAKEVAGELFIS